MFSLTHALKSSITGQFELTRLIGGVGGLAYVLGTHAFLWWEVVHLGKPFDLTSYCLAFPTGLAAIGGGTAAGAALKDRTTASASGVIASTGASVGLSPAAPPGPPPPPPPMPDLATL